MGMKSWPYTCIQSGGEKDSGKTKTLCRAILNLGKRTHSPFFLCMWDLPKLFTRAAAEMYASWAVNHGWENCCYRSVTCYEMEPECESSTFWPTGLWMSDTSLGDWYCQCVWHQRVNSQGLTNLIHITEKTYICVRTFQLHKASCAVWFWQNSVNRSPRCGPPHGLIFIFFASGVGEYQKPLLLSLGHWLCQIYWHGVRKIFKA